MQFIKAVLLYAIEPGEQLSQRRAQLIDVKDHVKEAAATLDAATAACGGGHDACSKGGRRPHVFPHQSQPHHLPSHTRTAA